MPCLYHLKLELYPTPEPTLTTSRGAHQQIVWVPPAGTSIFHDIPLLRRPDHGPACESVSLGHRSPASISTSRLDFSTTSFTDRVPEDVIDCGAPRAPSGRSNHRTGTTSERLWLDREDSLPAPSSSAGLRPQTAIKDWRFGRVRIQTVDLAANIRGANMSEETSQTGPLAAPSLGPTLGGAGTATRAELVPLESKSTEVGWGIVHFYREDGESTRMATDDGNEEQEMASSLDDCKTLCIPAVPAYMSPSDFLGFVGDGWRNELSHCRLVMTSSMNRYLALLNFRESNVAQKWKREFNGKVFNSVEPQLCHVVSVKSITFETPALTHGADGPSTLQPPPKSTASSSLGPFPPPTRNLIELPTCPVCLERMDETNGLMTVPCSHVFHCTCLQNWKGAGCPVCRFTNASDSGGAMADATNPYSQPFGTSISNLCSVCDCTDDLWICLLCGYVGCGRYKGGHAKDHWKDTAHSFALELETQYVWDYAGDMWVHRLIRDKGDGKVVELPERSTRNRQAPSEDVVPRAKVDNMGLEYTHLIISQLESQRAYYEDLISKAADKAARAAGAAESMTAASSSAMEKLNDLEERYKVLTSETIPRLEKDLAREQKKASKSEALARDMSKAFQEEKRVSEGLMKRIEHLGSDNEAVKTNLAELKTENEELKEMNRDLSMFISGQEKLRALEKEGKLDEGEMEGGSAGVPQKKGRRRKR